MVKRWVIAQPTSYSGVAMYPASEFQTCGPEYVLASDYDALAARLARELDGIVALERVIVERGKRLAAADALLLMTKWSVLCVAEDAYRAHRLDISDSQYALLNRIDAFRASDSATHRETANDK